MKQIYYIVLVLVIGSCTVQKKQLDLNNELGANHVVKQNENGVYAIAFSEDNDEVSKKFIIYKVDGMELLYKDVLPKGGEIKWYNNSYIQIVEFGVMPKIEDAGENKTYYLKVPEMNKVKVVNKE